MAPKFLFNLGLGIVVFFCSLALHAASYEKLFEDILNPSNNHTISHPQIRLEDFRWEWIGRAPEGVNLATDTESLEWIRIRDVLVLPRARARLSFARRASGYVATPVSTVPFANEEATHFAFAVVAMEAAVYELHLDLAGVAQVYAFRLHYAPRDPSARTEVFFDNSCSRFNLREKVTESESSGWLSVGCTLDPMASSGANVPSLNALIFWQRRDGKILVNGVPHASAVDELLTAALAPGLTPAAPPRSLELENEKTKVELTYALSPRIPKVNVAVGAGPYFLNYEMNQQVKNRVVLMPTLYASYATSATSRLIAFEATPLAHPWTTDLGVYLAYDTAKFFDRRVSLQVLLGGHMIAFDSLEGYKFKFGAPQGAELMATDVFARGYNMSAGAFIFPWIGGKAYNNVWLRYGSRRAFIEMNYLLWKEEVGHISYSSKSWGLSVGMPIPALSFF